MAKKRIVAKREQATQENTSSSVAPYLELGITGVTRYGGVSRVYEEFLKELQGPAGMKLLREFKDNCPIAGAFLFAAQHLGRHTTFRIDPADKSNQAMEIAERIRGAIFDDMEHPWPDTLSEHLSVLPFGWAVQEMVFKKCQGMTPPPLWDKETGAPIDRSNLLPSGHIPGDVHYGQDYSNSRRPTFTPSRYDDGVIGLKKLSLRAQETLFMWEWDTQSNPIVLQQMAPPDYGIRRIPLSKCMHLRTETTKNNPEGRSILRNAVLSYVYRKNIENIEAIGVERDLAGYPTFQIAEPTRSPGHAVPDIWNTRDANAVTLKNNLQALLRSIKRDEQEGLLLPWWLDFKLVTAGGARRQFDTNAIIQRYDQRIAMSVLADFVLIGHQATGSRGLASTKGMYFSTALTGILSIITASYNRQVIPMLMQLNGWPMELMPKMAHGEVESIDLADLGMFIANLARSGMPLFPDPDLERSLLEAAKLPSQGDVIDPQTEVYDQPGDQGGEEPDADSAQPQPSAQPSAQPPAQSAQQPTPQQQAAKRMAMRLAKGASRRYQRRK